VGGDRERDRDLFKMSIGRIKFPFSSCLGIIK
jgi:hypothetical protein